jgi:cytoskeletal protein RodZ
MQTIGEKLEEARKRKGISIREAAETTKIRGDYLQKFEANTFEIDLPPLYLKGFVRSYARFLELDAERIVSELNSLLSEGKPVRRDRENREVYGRVDFGEPGHTGESSHAPAGNRGGGSTDQSAVIKLGLIGGGAVIGLLIIFLLIKVLFGDSTPARPTPSSSSEPAVATAPVDVAQTLTFTALEPTRVKVVQEADGAVLISDKTQPFTRNETRSIRKVGSLIVTVEDRTKIRIEINGRLIGIPVFPANQANGNFGQFRIE